MKQKNINWKIPAGMDVIPALNNYLRIDDNQLGIFATVYLSKKIVFTSETGCTVSSPVSLRI
jgi:hypothetical protein